MNITKIYLVTNCFGDPNKVYIGKTKNHEGSLKNNRKNKHKKIFGNNIIFSYIDQVESLNSKDWKPLECFWIEYFRQLGFDLQNKNKGGGGVNFCSEEHKSKIGIRNKGRKLTEKQKTQISLINKGKTLSNETKKKIGDANRGNKQSEHTIKIKKDKITGLKRTEEHKQKYRNCKTHLFKPVLQYDLEGNFIKEWHNKRQAALYIKELKQNNGNIQSQIRDCCNGKQKTCHGYVWKWK